MKKRRFRRAGALALASMMLVTSGTDYSFLERNIVKAEQQQDIFEGQWSIKNGKLINGKILCSSIDHIDINRDTGVELTGFNKQIADGKISFSLKSTETGATQDYNFQCVEKAVIVDKIIENEKIKGFELRVYFPTDFGEEAQRQYFNENKENIIIKRNGNDETSDIVWDLDGLGEQEWISGKYTIPDGDEEHDFSFEANTLNLEYEFECDGSVFVDNKKPVVTADDSTGAFPSKEITVKISDRSFVDSNVSLNIIKDGVETAGTFVNPNWEFTENEYSEIEYSNKIKFDSEGEYSFSINVTDGNGNAADEYISKTFIIDSDTPVIEVQENIADGSFIKDSQTFHISVTDKYFDKSSAVLKYDITRPGKTKESGLTKTLNWTVDANNPKVHHSKVTFDDEEGEIKFTIDCKDSAGRSAQQYVSGTFTIDKRDPVITFASVTDGEYVQNKKSIEITIDESYFDESNTGVFVTRTVGNAELANPIINDKKIEGLNWTAKTTDDGKIVYTTVLAISEEGRYTAKVVTTDKAGRKVEKTTGTFTVDKNLPVGSIKVVDREYVKEWTGINFVGFNHFTSKKVDVTIFGKDVTFDELDSITYLVSDTPLSEAEYKTGLDASTNKTVFTSEQTSGFNSQFSIPGNDEGKKIIYAKITDKSGRSIYLCSEEGVIVDSTKPVISLETDITDGSFLQGSQTVTILVNDKNFDADNTTLVYEITKPGKEKVSNLTKSLVWTQDTAQPNIHKATVTFDEEGEYSFVVESIDKAGTPADSLSRTFTIDMSAPVISVNSVTDGEFVQDLKEIEIAVDENYFDEDNTKVYVTRTIGNAELETPVLTDKEISGLIWNASTKDNGEYVYTTKLSLSEEGRYFVKVETTDKSGRSDSETTGVFTVDKNAPEGSIKFYNGQIDKEWKDVGFTGFNLHTSSDVEVTVSGKDVTFDELDSITYIVTDRELTEEEYKTQIENSGIKTSYTTVDSSGYKAEFNITDEGKKVVYAKIADKSGKVTYVSSNEGIILDKTAPVISIDEEIVNGSYVQDNQIVHITVTDANFDVSSAVLKYDIKRPNKAKETGLTKELNFTRDTLNPDVYRATVNFDEEGEYKFTIDCNDMAGTPASQYVSKTFNVDKSAPVVTIDTVTDGEFVQDKKEITISIKDNNFDSAKTKVLLTKTFGEGQFTDKELSGITWSTTEVEGPDVHKTKITVSDEGKYYVKVVSSDKSGKTDVKTSGVFAVDNNAPNGSVIVANSQLSKTWMGLTFLGFNLYTKETIKVAITGEDVTFDELESIAYIVSDKELTATEYTEQLENTANVTNFTEISTEGYKVEFDIDAEGKKVIYAKVTDKSGRVTYLSSEEGMIVDKTAPVITIDENIVNGSYIKDSQPVHISVTDKNFDETSAVLEYEITRPGKTKETGLTKPLTFTQDEANPDVYRAEVTFDEEGEYKFTIDCKDKAGNDATQFVSNGFTIDKIEPEISIETVIDGEFVQNKKQLKITVTENYFDKANTKVFVTRTIGNAELSEPVITDREINGLTWNQVSAADGKIAYEAILTLTDEGRYSVKVSTTDKVGRQDEEITGTFTIDNNAPLGSVIVKNTQLDKEWTGVDFIGFNLHTKHTANVTITGKDITFDELESITYIVSDTALTKAQYVEQLEASTNVVSFTEVKTEGYTVQFDIPSEGKKIVYAKVTDKSGRNTYVSSQDGIIIDKTVPVITIDETIVDGSFVKDSQTIHISVTDKNFNPDSGVLKYDITRPGKATETDLTKELVFTQDATNPDVYRAEVAFDEEGQYIFTIDCMDKAENEATQFVSKTFTVDKYEPVITVDSVVTGEFLQDEKSFKVSIEENYFDEANTRIFVTRTLGNSELSEPVYTDREITGLDWKQTVAENGNFVHTTELSFTEEGKYVVRIETTDKAGRFKETTTEEFAVDNTNPSGSIKIENTQITDNNVWTGVSTEGVVHYTHEDVTVTVTGEDTTFSELKSITYYMSGTELTEEQYIEKINNDGVETEYSEISEDGYSVSFIVPKELEGKKVIYAKITDMSGRETYLGSASFIIDETAPSINIIEKISDYTNNSQKVSIIVDDKNFDEETAVLSYELTRPGKNKETGLVKELNWTAVEGNPYRYKTTVVFEEEGVYQFTIDCKDKTETPATQFVSKRFTIDKTKPEIVIQEKELDIKEGKRDDIYVDQKQVVHVSVKDVNFNPENTVLNYSKANPNVDTVTGTKELKWSKGKEAFVYEATVTFDEEGEYKFTIDSKDLAGNNANQFVSNKFTVDKNVPSAKISINNNDLNLGWNKLVNSNPEYKYFTDEAISVKISAFDSIHKIKKVEYVVVYDADKVLTEQEFDKTKKTGTFDNGGNPYTYKDDNVGYEFALPSIDGDKKFVIYAKVTDMTDKTVYISSEGVIADKTAPETSTPLVSINANPLNGIYNKDLIASYTVTDPIVNNTFSGLNKVNYRVDAIDRSGNEVLYSIGGEIDCNGSQKYDGQISIDRNKFNTNLVKISIDAVDRAGNVMNTKVQYIAIDATAPTAKITYDNNNVTGNEKFFNSARTMRIAITERNFDASKFELVYTKNGETVNISGSNLEWTKTNGTASNADDTVYTANVLFNEDADYVINSITTSDLAGNQMSSVVFEGSATTDFTIDNITPVISTNSVAGYYSNPVTVTATINEHNFNPQDASILVTKKLNGSVLYANQPVAANWSEGSDIHTATISFPEDGDYSFVISFKDKASREATAYASPEFTVDNTDPVLTSNISPENKNIANKADVNFEYIYSDVNSGNTNGMISYSVKTLSGRNVNWEPEIENTTVNGNNAYKITFKDLAASPAIKDGIYVIHVEVKDKAGRVASNDVTVSVNREGSAYDYTEGSYIAQVVKDEYVKQIEDNVELTVMNYDEITQYQVVVYTSLGEQIILREKDDYDWIKDSVDGEGYQKFICSIHKDVFKENGKYTVQILSKDKADDSYYGENATMISNEKAVNTVGAINFTVDNIPPEVVLSGVKNNESYDNAREIVIDYSDVNKIASVVVERKNSSGKVIDTKVFAEKEIEEAGASTGTLKYTAEQYNGYQTISVTVTDVAGNEETESVKVLITSNMWVRFVNNTPLLVGSIAAVVVIVSFILVLLLKKKKKDSDEK